MASSHSGHVTFEPVGAMGPSNRIIFKHFVQYMSMIGILFNALMAH